jgi:hypothetical protein
MSHNVEMSIITNDIKNFTVLGVKDVMVKSNEDFVLMLYKEYSTN